MGIANPQIAVCDIEEMNYLASIIAKRLKPGTTLTLSGAVGTGKTTFTKMLAGHLDISSEISSPTYTYLNIYEEKVAHFDLYRLKNEADFFSLGFEEYLDSGFITIIEWPEVINNYLPNSAIHLLFSHQGSKRRIESNVEILI